jgi:excinuclease ABC subunit C
MSPKTAIMLGHAVSVDFIVTNTEKETLILEASLIKHHKPRYNIRLRDDKAYPFLRIDIRHPFPRLSITRRRADDEALYFGPYPSASAVRETMRFIGSIFPLRTCTNHSMKNRGRPCLKYQIKRCCAPCSNKITEQAYREMVKQVTMFLSGRHQSLTNMLEAKMQAASDKLEFEKAAVFRDQLQAVHKIIEKQIVVSHTEVNMDVIGLFTEDTRGMFSIIKVRNGLVTGSENIRFENITNEKSETIMGHFIKMHYSSTLPTCHHDDIPSIIYTPVMPEDKDLIEETLSEISSQPIRLTSKQHSTIKALTDMARKNAEQSFASALGKEEAWKTKALAIMRSLDLNKAPDTVEGIDISNTGGSLSVGSLVVFRHGHPVKHSYRLFTIKKVSGPDDYASIHEVVTRRIHYWQKHKKTPDMVMIDGGKGQLAKAINALQALPPEERPELVAIAKDSNGTGDRLFRPGMSTPVSLPPNSEVLRFFQYVRDEAHRFGISAHRKKRLKRGIRSELDSIKGIGPARHRALLRYFGSVSRIKTASPEELKMVKGIPAKLAEEIYRHFH